jgi:hypothetical protein
MKTLLALLIMFMACTMGLIAVAIVMVVMGFAGAPGAMLFAAGKKAKSALLEHCLRCSVSFLPLWDNRMWLGRMQCSLLGCCDGSLPVGQTYQLGLFG